MSKKIITFYILVAIIILGKVTATLFERSTNVHHGQRVAVLQQKKTELIRSKQAITEQLATQTALIDIDLTAAEAGFTAIDRPVIISSGQKLASSGL